MEIPKTRFVITFANKDLSADATPSEFFSFSDPIVNWVAGSIKSKTIQRQKKRDIWLRDTGFFQHQSAITKRIKKKVLPYSECTTQNRSLQFLRRTSCVANKHVQSQMRPVWACPSVLKSCAFWRLLCKTSTRIFLEAVASVTPGKAGIASVRSGRLNLGRTDIAQAGSFFECLGRTAQQKMPKAYKSNIMWTKTIQ